MRFLWLPLILAGCLPQVGPLLSELDAGPELDAGLDAGRLTADAGMACANGLRDGDESDIDCGGSCQPCATGASCGTPTDCVTSVCVSGRCADPASTCRSAFAGCTSFVDLTTAATPTIQFPVGGDRYSPDCVRVKLGQTVTFTGGSFSAHPLDQACGPVPGLISGQSGNTRSVTFTQGLGVYGFYCNQHGSASGAGMAGAIEVVR